MASETNGAKKSLLTKFKNGFKESFFSQYILSNKASLPNLLVGLVAFGLERLLHDKVFHCPVHHYKTYGNIFQFAPLVCLFFVNLLAIVDYSCLSLFSFPCVKRYRRASLGYGVARDIIKPFVTTFFTSLVGPMVWLISSMIRGRFYVCARLGYDILLKPNITQQFVDQRIKPAHTDLKLTRHKYEEWVHEYESEAHVVGWIALVLLVAVGTMIVLINRCYLNNDERMIGMMEYEKREAIAAFAQFKHWADNKRDDEVEEPVMEAKGLPEIAGREMVLFLIKKAKSDLYNDSKHRDKNVFAKVYEDVISVYPRVAQGNVTFPYRWSLDHDFEDVEDELVTTTTCCPGEKRRKRERKIRAKYLLELFYEDKMKQENSEDVGVGTESCIEKESTDGRTKNPEADVEQPYKMTTTETSEKVHSIKALHKPPLDSKEEIELHEIEHTERDNLLV